ncbi:MAG: leucine-rich repeat protein [Clostridia bacterium]|nr:leucine-rich repeat protein [Clostridia bacterium]
MKRKLWTALLLAALTTTLLSTAAAAEDWGSGGWEVAKRKADWNPDGIWAEGEYYSVDPAYDTENYQAANDELYERAENLNYMMAMSWDEDYLYTYISYQAPAEPVVSADLWDGHVIQFSGTDVGNETIYNENGEVTDDPRLEIGITRNFETDEKISTNWCTWLDSDYGFDSNCTDDFEAFFCDGWVTYEFRVPFAAFSEITPAVNEQVGVAYVIAVGDGDWNYSHVQIGQGVTGGKHAELHSVITLTDTFEFPERDGNAYYILFHNIGNNNPHSEYFSYYESGDSLQYYGTDGAEDTAYADDLLALLPEEKREEMQNVEGYDFINFRLAYWNETDGVGSVVENRQFKLTDKVSLADVQDYAFYDGYNWCIMFTACYDPEMYTVKFNNIGNVNPGDYWSAQKMDVVPFDTNFYDIFPYEWDYPTLFDVPGFRFDRWRVLDFTNEVENPGYEEQYMSGGAMYYGGAATEDGRYPLDGFIAGFASEMESDEYPVITLRAVYYPIDYTIRFVDDDGVTELRDSVVLHIGDGIRDHFPEIPEKDYGTFTHWKLDWVNGEDGFYTMPYDDADNPGYPIDENLIEKCAVDTDDDGFGDTITLVAEYELNEDAGDLRASGIIETENGDIQWEVHWNGLLFVGNHDLINGLVIPDYEIWEGVYAPWHPYRNYITELEIGSEIGVIGKNAFAELQRVDYLFIPGNVKEIRENAFIDCWNVGYIELDYGIEKIGRDAFCGCNTGDLWIPETVTEMDRASFAHLGTNWYGVDGNNPVFHAVDGVLFYEADGRYILWAYPKWDGRPSYAVPEGVDTIGACAFKWAENVKSVILPDSLKSIEDAAFSRSGVETIQIPAGVVFLDNGAFEGTNSLSSVYFYGPVPTDYVGYEVFTENTDDFTIYYLEGQEGWTEGTWDNPYTEDAAEAYPTATFSADVNFAEGSIEGYDITWYITMDGRLYVNGSGEIPDYIWEYGYSWYDHMNSIREIHIGDDITRIGNHAFDCACYVSALTLPKNLVEVGAHAFNGQYNNVGTLVLPYQVETLDYSAFWDMGITKVTIPASTTLIVGNVFAGCPVEEYVVESGNPVHMADEYGVLYYLENGKVAAITAYPMASELTEYTIPEGEVEIDGVTYDFAVTDIDDRAIHCTWNLEKITLPETLCVIKEHSLSYNNNLWELTIPASVCELYRDALAYNWNLPSILFEGNKPDMHDEEEGTQFRESGGYCDTEFTIYYYEGAEGWADYTLYKTVAIGEDGVMYSGTIDDTITWYITADGKLYVNGSGSIPNDVGDYEYSWHNHKDFVKEIHIGEGIKVIGNNAFSGFGNATVLTLPDSLEEIWTGAFHDTGITHVTIPAATWQIIDNVFGGSPVEEITVEEGNLWHAVDEYGALYYMEDENYGYLLSYPAASEGTELTVQEGTHHIGNHAIYGTSLTSITLPGSLQHIGYAGICLNEGLTSLTIPASVGEVEERALAYNRNLSAITFEGDKPNLWSEEEGLQFEQNAEDFTIYYYEGAEGWVDYTLYPTVALRRTSKGDVTGDGKVTENDLALLTQYFAGYPVEVDVSVIDIDGENGLTRKDVMILKRYIAGWEGYDQYFAE